MPIQFANVPIVFRSGLDTLTDSKNGVLGTFVELENAVTTHPGRFEKRPGYQKLSTTIENSAGSITAARAVSVFNDELLLYTGSNVYTFISATSTWSNRGAVSACLVSQKPVVRNAYAQRNPDIAYAGGIYVTVWEDFRGGSRYAVHDAANGAVIVDDAAITTGSTVPSTQPRVIAFQNQIAIFYLDETNGTILYRRINPSTPTALGAEVNPISTLHASPSGRYDIAVIGARLWILWNDTVVTNLNYFDATWALGTAVSPLNASPNAVALWGDASLNVWCSGANSTDIFGAVVNYATASVATVAAIETVANVQRIAGYTSGTTGHYFYEVTAATSVSDYNIRTNTLTTGGTVGTAARFLRSVGLWSRFFTYNDLQYVAVAHQSTLQSTILIVDTSGNTVARVLPSSAGGLRTIGTCCSVVSGASSGLFAMASTIKGQLLVDDTASPPVLYASTGIGRTELDFVSSQNFASVTQGRNLITAGGLVQSYDGVSYTEHGFHFYPEDVAITKPATTFGIVVTGGTAGTPEIDTITLPAGSTIKSGQYFTITGKGGGGPVDYYVWFNVSGRGGDPAPAAKTAIAVAILDTDTASQVATKTATAIAAVTATFASAVPVGAVVTTTNAANGDVTDAANPAAPNGVETGSIVAGTYQYSVVYSWVDARGQIHRSAPSVPVQFVAATGGRIIVKIPTLRVTSKTGTRQAVRMDVYRTKDTGVTFYRVADNPSTILNDLTTDYVYFVDTHADSEIGSNEVLYTEGKYLEAIAPPSASLIANYRTRVFLGGLEDPNVVQYSLATEIGEAVRFNDQLTISVDPLGGPITAFGVLDDKFIIFKRDAIYALAGDGPTQAGQSEDYGNPQRVTTDAGCQNPQSIVVTPVGLMFQSTKGIYLLDRSLQASYIGAPVRSYNDIAITSAALIPNTNQVRFMTATGTALVYDYLVQQWSTFTGMPAVDCDIWQSTFAYVRADGSVWKEDSTVFTDGGSFYRMKMTTSWIAMAGLQGFKRVQRALVVGDYRGQHKLRVRVATDFNDAFLQEAIFDAGTLIGSSTFGSSTTFGSDSVFGGPYVPEQFGVHIASQKCQAIRFSVEDIQTSAYNEGYRISGLTLVVGLKKGVMKLPANRRA